MSTTFADFLLSKLQEYEREQGHRVSLHQFADYLGVSRPVISYWLSGKSIPSLDSVRILASKYGHEVYDVLDLDRDPNLVYIEIHWNNLPPAAQKELKERVENYISKDENG